MQLHDFALSSGMLDRMPEFGRQLRETTEKFLSLAREASDDESKEGEPKTSNSSASDSRSSNPRSHSGSSEQTNSSATTADTTSPELAPDEQPKPLWGGLTISHEPLSQADFVPSIPLTLPSAASPLPSLIPPTSTTSYEVLTHPTLDNASFPFLPPSTTLPPSPSPYLSLAPPNSYAAHEATFGRRLQRYAMERSLLLFSLPNPPASLIRRIFGFCLLLESPATIERRLRRVLGHDAQHSLSNWQFPFYHLGGAGRHFDGSSSGSSGEVGENGTGTGTGTTPKESEGGGGGGGGLRIGNQGTVEFLKPAATAGFATGPFQADVTAVRDRELDGDMRMMLPGFGGEYFDCDEAELYLYQRGVVIPPGADVVTVEVDPGAFGGAGDAGSLSSSSPTGSVGSEEMAGGAAAPWGTVNGGIDPGLGGVFAQGNPFMPATTMAGSSSASSLDSTADGANLFSFGALLPDGPGSSGYGLGTARHKPNRRKVVIDVMTLLKGGCRRYFYTTFFLKVC